jgi:thioredoxin 1
MANQNVMEFTDGNFETEVLASQHPVLVDFWAEWCMPCRTLAPVIDAVAEELAGKAKVGKLDTDNNRGVAMKYGITAIPTVIIFKGGEPVKRFVGFKKKDELIAALTDAGAAAKA